jgi:broad specificity phosphatase PhoE
MQPQTKTIFIVRHGETDFNQQGIVQGSGVDSSLNNLGRAQAQAFFDDFQDIPFGRIFTSTLQRTHQSVQGFINKNIPWVQLPGLNEISWGNREGRKPDAEDNKQFFAITSEWKRGNTHVSFLNGESPDQVATRQMQAFQQILENPIETPVLVAMHGRAMKILLAKLLHNDLTKMDLYEHSNLCLYIINYNYATEKYTLKLAKFTDHLQHLKTERHP